MLDQRRSPFCSLYALAVAAGHTMRFKFQDDAVFFEAQNVLDSFQRKFMPIKRMWPLDVAQGIGAFDFPGLQCTFELRLVEVQGGWDETCRCIKAFGGFLCVIVIAVFPTCSHTLVAQRVCEARPGLQCQNSHGTTMLPIFTVRPQHFHTAYIVDVRSVGMQPSEEWQVLSALWDK